MGDQETENNTPFVCRHPNELMKLHLLNKKNSALVARMRGNKPKKTVSTEKSRVLSEQNQDFLKRRNPFRCEPNKKFKSDLSNSVNSGFDHSNDNTVFQILNVSQPSKKNDENLETSFANILSKMKKEVYQNSEVPEEHSGEKCIPVDWSLKLKLRLISEEPFSWTSHLKTCEEASGITGFVRCIDSNTSRDNPNCSLDTSPNARFHQCCLVWQYPSFPWMTLFPRSQGRVSSKIASFAAANADLRTCLHRDWGENFRSLFQLVRALQCPYFYVCANTFTCLFRAAGVGGISDVHVFVTPTTSGFRQLLKNEDVEYTMPLKKSRRSSKLSNDSNSDLGYDTQDSSSDLLSLSRSTNTSERNVGGGEDDEDDDDDDETADEWLLRMGMEMSEIKKLNAREDKLSSEKTREIDQSPESLVYVEGVEVQGFFNFLLNCKSIISTTGSLSGIPPTLLSPVAFRGASLIPLKVQASKIKVDTRSYHSLEIRGPILPHTIHNLCGLIKLEQQYSITFAHVESTKPFSHTATSSVGTQTENKTEIDSVKTPVKVGIPTVTPSTPTSKALCEENLSDCGLPHSLIEIMCNPDVSSTCVIDSIRCNGDGTYTWT